MSYLEIDLLGPPLLRLDGRPLQVRTVKAIPLLAYLALNPGCHHRISLATLLWTELDQERAFAALRTTLWKLKKAGLDDWIEVQRDQLGLLPDRPLRLDVLDFRHLLGQCREHTHPPGGVCPTCLPILSAAVTLYRGDFMQGFSLRDALAFDDWQRTLADTLRDQLIDAMRRLVRGYQSQNDPAQAIHYARRWLALNRFNEEPHRQLMLLYASTGQRPAALNQYQECQRILKRSDLEPQPETTALYHQILGNSKHHGAANDTAGELGTPIILCADIEDAAALWAHHRQNMAEVLNRFTASIKELARRYAGQVAKINGDHAILLFERGQPLQFALALQKHSRRPVWGEIGPLKVRIAIHAVENHPANPEGYAADIHRANRLLSAGWGGQILLSAQALGVLDLPAKSQLQDFDLHTLKDLGEPIHIYGLLQPDLPGGHFPPLQSLSRYRHNLPTYPTPFIGREKELAELEQLLSKENCRLLTLIGPGGIGKTRLALQSAAQQAERFSDGVFFIPLAVPKTAEQIHAVVAEVLRFNFYRAEDPARQIQDYLRAKHMLLIMDNFEHLVQGAEILSEMLGGAPGLKILVTSRERLNLQDEWLYDVPGMSLPPPAETASLESYSAVQLFLQNARRVRPGFIPTESDWGCINRICQLVDGLPLALELASGWVRTLTCCEIANQIASSLDFLTTSMPDRPPRHRSLRAAFDHSWALLSEEDRRTLRKLSIFRGSFSMDAAQAVAAAPPFTLAALVDRSLLHCLSGERYEMSETLRHFAFNYLAEAPDDYLSTTSLHCEYYMRLLVNQIPGLVTRPQLQSMDEINSNIENVRAAWNYAVKNEKWNTLDDVLDAYYLFYEVSGRALEGYDTFDKTLRAMRQAEPAVGGLRLARLLTLQGWFAFRVGYHTEGISYLEESLAIFQKLDTEQNMPVEVGQEMALGLAMLSSVHLLLGNLSQTGHYLNTSLALYKDRLPVTPKTLTGHTFALHTAGRYAARLNDDALAKRYLQEGLAICEQIGNYWGTARLLDTLGQLTMRKRELPEAENIWRRALQIASEIGDRRGTASIYNSLAQIYELRGEPEKAIEAELRSLEISRELGDRRFSAIVLNNLAYHHLTSHQNYPTALQYYHESLVLFREVNDERGLLYTTYDLGQAHLQIGDLPQALHCHEQALRMGYTMKNPSLMLYVLHGIACVATRRADTERALELCALMIEHPETQADTRERARTLAGELMPPMPPELAQAAYRRGQQADLAQLVEHLLQI